MLQSKLIGETKKEWPNEASIKSHGLLLKGGYIKQMASGIYTLLPLAKKVVSKIENIIREEMNNIDAQEILMPLVATKKLWDMSGRYDSVGSELLRFKDRNDTEMVLSMTHEEATVFTMLNEGKSYQKYPFSVYQIQTKFRDEARPRAGLIRVREFTMKDAYSFHTSKESLDKEYDKFFNAYNNIYRRVGIKEVIAVASDTGMMGGSGAHEFMLLCDAGEDKIVVCKNCGYSANMEVAYTDNIETSTKEENSLEKISTPNIKAIEELHEFTKIPVNQIGKAVIYQRLDTMQTVIVFIRADREVNETKLRNLLNIDDENVEVLNDVSFEIKPNETVSFVGKSGAGKSTIFNLIAGLYHVNQGSIYLDGIPVEELSKESLRGNLSIISQNPYIFNMSIRENLTIIKHDLTEEEMVLACKRARLHDFIMTLKDGYDTIVGESGVTLSGGQRQRLAIARALIQKTEIILFDEATSALDNETQAEIQQSIHNMQGEYTILIIAHRLSTVINSDRLILIDQGKVKGIGTHQELLEHNAIYKKLYELELSDEEKSKQE